MTVATETQLWVNIDHVATLRQARMTPYPDIATAVAEVEQGGAEGITVHLREDRRHIQDQDVYDVRKLVNTWMNLEMAATDEMVGIALKVRPDECCIVPEKREELTTEGGLDVAGQLPHIRNVCKTLADHDIKVSLFIDPVKESIDAAKEAGAQAVELHTGQYALQQGAQQEESAEQISEMAWYAHSLCMHVNAGHGLHRDNVRAIADNPVLSAVNIGHAIIADAMFMGLKNAVLAMREAMKR